MKLFPVKFFSSVSRGAVFFKRFTAIKNHYPRDLVRRWNRPTYSHIAHWYPSDTRRESYYKNEDTRRILCLIPEFGDSVGCTLWFLRTVRQTRYFVFKKINSSWVSYHGGWNKNKLIWLGLGKPANYFLASGSHRWKNFTGSLFVSTYTGITRLYSS